MGVALVASLSHPTPASFPNPLSPSKQTSGALFALLRYVTWMQRGMKQASDAYARVMASLGSLERVVELHDRGVRAEGAVGGEWGWNECGGCSGAARF